MAPKNKINLKDRLENGELDLSMSDLQEVPVKEIAAVKKATSLDLSNNRLTTLGKNFITLTHIIKLDLSKNQLTELPEDFGEMRQLKHLDLYSNQITHLPLSFCELKSLRWLDLKNNPLVPAVAKVVGPCLDAQQCQQSARATVAFLTELSANVEEERERLRQQELKQLEAQQDKERQQRKRNERKKAAKAKKKEMKKEMEKEEVLMENAPKHETDQTNGVNWKVPKDNDQKLKKQAKTKSRLSFLSFLFLCIPSLTILAFLISASGILGPTGDLWREHLTNQWSQLLEKLPVSAKPWGDKLTVLISNLHGSTSILINNICDVVVDFSQSEQVSTSLEFLAQTFSVVSNHSVEMFRTMKEKVLFITEEITKKIT